MHDLDRRSMELTGESFEFAAEGEEEVFGEAELQELASELLSVTQEGELDRFLGGLIKKAAGAVGKIVSSPLGRQLGGMLRSAAKRALPMAGRAIGNWVAPGSGGDIGHRLGAQAGAAFGLETEGLSHEDREFEVAKQFVRFAGDATRNAVSAPGTRGPAGTARDAVARAAERFAPGLVGSAGRPQGGGQSGRWVRRGRRIVIYGL
jgi:hypothetical protein